ncbi:hypothetical protein [Sporichthya sp.]|uniref:AtuA-related protein n=1 Tax=Sporichthya sp. TaxID=65475 RepID=UPI001792BC8E|nr:hypothetical protein [Sporichthya sp.]MBA3741519.1 hypothetical protein [Sporichthya sp.]
MRVHDLSYVRSGDKGDIANVVVLARDADAYSRLAQELLPEAIAAHMGELVQGPITVYPMPNLEAFQIVMYGALGGGATRTLRFDATGKSMCTILSRMPLREGEALQ